MQRVHCDELIKALNSIPQNYFDLATVTDCLKTHPIEEASLQDYLYFDSNHPARNLIFKNDLFELIAACWDVGQTSPVQSYIGCKCWIALFSGRLRLQTYQIPHANPNSPQLTDAFELRHDFPVVISTDEPIHQILNLNTFKERAVSLHVFSPAVTGQIVYGTKDNQQTVRRPLYHSQYGNREQPG